MFQSNCLLFGRQFISIPTILPVLPTQIEIGSGAGVTGFALADPGILAINIAAALAPASQRHACFKD
jgi:hypothetical protein